ncbi:MAG: alpha/beta hydrolase [Candidatus Helarchaeota archaeon]
MSPSALPLQKALFLQKWTHPFFKQFTKSQVQKYTKLLTKLRQAINPHANVTSLESYFQTSDGCNIFYQLWLPQDPVEKILVMCHGFQCHSDLYYVLADYFYNKNIAIAAWDQRGHGRSCGPHGHLSSFSIVFQDLAQFLQILQQRFPSTPLYLMGESMGALIVLQFAIKYPKKITGVITLAPGFRPRLPIFKFIMLLLPLLYPLKIMLSKASIIRIPSDFDNPIYIPAFNEYDMNDLLHLNPVSLGLLYNLLKLMLQTQPKRIGKDPSLPILICQGTGDKSLDFRGAIELYQQISLPDKTLHLYPHANHSLLMDRNSKKIYSDLYSWIKKH